MLKQRIITALILAPAAIAAIFYLPMTYFAGLLMAIIAIGAWEWARFMGITNTLQRLAYAAITSALVASIWYVLPVQQTWLVLSGLQIEMTTLLWVGVVWWVVAVFFYVFLS